MNHVGPALVCGSTWRKKWINFFPNPTGRPRCECVLTVTIRRLARILLVGRSLDGLDGSGFQRT